MMCSRDWLESSSSNKLKKIAMKIHSLTAALLVQALALSAAHGASIKICADVPEEFATSDKQAINTKGSQKPTLSSSKTVVSEANKVKALLQCTNEGPSLDSLIPTESAQLSVFDRTVLEKAKKKALTTESLARALFLSSLMSSGQQIFGTSESTEKWAIYQARIWCQKNDASVDQTAKVPKLLSLGDGVKSLDANAIGYAWRAVAEFPSTRLGDGCSQAVKAFKAKVSGTSPAKQ